VHLYAENARLFPCGLAEVRLLAPRVISIVDDDDDVRSATARLIRAMGYEARVYASAEAFLDSADTNETDCLILDVQMPGMSGPELQQTLLRTAKPAPIVFVTAFPNAKLEADVLAAGAVGMLAKPCDGKALVALIEVALASRP
jgi:FixJ family two-component response regulator